MNLTRFAYSACPLWQLLRPHLLESVPPRAAQPGTRRTSAPILGLRTVTPTTADVRQPVWAEVVTYVLSTSCHPCVRVGQGKIGCGGPLQLRQSSPAIRFSA